MKKFHTSHGTYTSKAGDYYYPSAASDDKLIRKTSCTVSLIGFILLVIVIVFILKNAEYALLAGTLVPGNPFGEGQQDDDTWKVIIGILILIVSLIAFPLSFIL